MLAPIRRDRGDLPKKKFVRGAAGQLEREFKRSREEGLFRLLSFLQKGNASVFLKASPLEAARLIGK